LLSIMIKSIGQFAKINSLFFLLAGTALGGLTSLSVKEQTSRYFMAVRDSLAAKGFRVDIKPGQYGSIFAGRQCKSALVFELNSDPLTQERNTLRVECRDEKPWKLYLGLDIALHAPVVISTQPIARNQIIRAQDIVLQEQQVNKGRYSHYSDPRQVIGLTAKQSLKAGATLTPNQLKSPTLVKRGDRVIIFAKNDAVYVKMDGVALSEGRIGEQIDVRNARSERVVRGVVVDQGMISITL
jgi:flagellar basal body P-ring formation protein FlgA